MKPKKIVNARRINKMRFISGITLCSIVIVVAFVSTTLNLINYYKFTTPEAGAGTLRMFTTISSIIAALSASMCLPFQIDGLRRDRYNLPGWIAIVMYVGAVGSFLTFTVALTVLSPYQGFVKTMFLQSNIFLHTLNPILITTLFCLIISDYRIKFKYSFISVIPVGIYMVIYFVMVYIAKVWNDTYHTGDIIPWPISLMLLIVLVFGISQLLRFLHNLSNKYVTKGIERYYKESSDFEFPLVSNAVAHLAKIESKFYHEGDDFYFPIDIINYISSRYGADKLPLDILYDIYLEQYLICIGKKSNVQPNN